MSTTTHSTEASAPSSHSDPNQIREPDRAIHQWYRFVLSFPPHLVQDYINKFGLTRNHCLLDPFCGTGTTVVEAKKQGIPCVGIEANPMAWFASTVKIDWTPNPAALLEVAAQISRAASRALETHGLPLRTLSEEQQRLILRNSISPLPLHKTLILLDHLRATAPPDPVGHLQLALAKALVTAISNLRFGPEVSVGKPKRNAPVIEAWQQEVETIAADIAQCQHLQAVPSVVHHADARQLRRVLAPNSIDAVITSPPYPNEKDYTRTTRLESVLLGFIQSKQELRRLKDGLIRSNTRNVFKADGDDRWVAKHSEIQRIAQTIEERRSALGKTSGFERLYARAVKLYFGGMAKHLADLRLVLRPGAQLAYVVGDQKSYLQVMVRTGELLADLAQGLGYELVGIDLFRTRLATATKEQIREEVVLLRWPGQFPSTPYPFGDEPL